MLRNCSVMAPIAAQSCLGLVLDTWVSIQLLFHHLYCSCNLLVLICHPFFSLSNHRRVKIIAFSPFHQSTDIALISVNFLIQNSQAIHHGDITSRLIERVLFVLLSCNAVKSYPWSTRLLLYMIDLSACSLITSQSRRN